MTAMTNTASFWDALAERYAAQPVKNPDAYEHTLERVRAHLQKTDRVLELGCGTGTTASKLSGAAGEILATDVSPGMVEIARRKAVSMEAANVRFQVADALTDPGTDWNAILAFNLLHLLRDPARVIRQVHLSLKPGGLFISKTACLGGWRAALFAPVIGAMRLIGKAPYVGFFSVGGLERMIEAEGFEILETGTFPASPPSRFIVARKR